MVTTPSRGQLFLVLFVGFLPHVPFGLQWRAAEDAALRTASARHLRTRGTHGLSSMQAMLKGHAGAQLAVSQSAEDQHTFQFTTRLVLNAVASNDFTRNCGASVPAEIGANIQASLNEMALGVCSATLHADRHSDAFLSAVAELRRVAGLGSVSRCANLMAPLRRALVCAERILPAPEQDGMSLLQTRKGSTPYGSFLEILHTSLQFHPATIELNQSTHALNGASDSFRQLGPSVDELVKALDTGSTADPFSNVGSAFDTWRSKAANRSARASDSLHQVGPLLDAWKSKVINTSSSAADSLVYDVNMLTNMIAESAAVSSASLLENAANLSAQVSQASLFKESAKVVEYAKGVTQQAYHCGFDTLWNSLKVYLNGGVRYGNWCGCNSCLKSGIQMSTKPNDELSFSNCGENETTGHRKRPQARVGFDTNNTVCADSGLDDACLLHDYGAYSQPASIVGQHARIFECRVNRALIQAALSKVNSKFHDGIGQEEGRFARSIACIQPVIPCLQWNGHAYEERYPFNNWSELDAVESKYRDGCGPTGCYLFTSTSDATPQGGDVNSTPEGEALT